MVLKPFSKEVPNLSRLPKIRSRPTMMEKPAMIRMMILSKLMDCRPFRCFFQYITDSWKWKDFLVIRMNLDQRLPDQPMIAGR
jgi:hypothetical protein